ncbi:hypothetical protein DPEC_G00064330 [Dallia pectoralis]|uniref:Uncharacterized protein n=1 Tax=Dallia pectoralis TaxID=75939 RepID=A0ACC2H821_DALPE|nr:hypothetical protein DPEC_G00064330 [Dallia pectoralis]
MNNPSQSMGVGQPHHQINHTRPFFYVQPPTQPYYNMHNWTMNPYGLPPSAMPYGRPYMAPYPYMQYPGYMVPQAPMQPVDYSRMFNPHISSATYDIQFRHHFQHQARVRQTTTCSEVQTDPSDTIHKLIDGLDRMATTEKPAGERGPVSNSGLMSLTSNTSMSSASSGTTVSSPVDVEAQPGGQGRLSAPRPLPQRQPQPSKSHRDNPVSSSEISVSTSAAVYDAESSQSCQDELAKQDGWSTGSGALPTAGDIRRDMRESRRPYPPDKSQNTRKTGINGLSEEHSKPPDNNVKHDCGTLTRDLDSFDGPSEQDGETVAVCSGAYLKDREKRAPPVEHLARRIPGLPSNKGTADVLLNDESLLYLDSVASGVVDLPRSNLPMSESVYYYSFYPPVAQDRQSVLSLSMDDLSSRDELFSTDVDDLDLISGPVYMGGGKLAEAARDTTDQSGKKNLLGKSEERFAACSKTCLSCGLSLVEEPQADKELGPCSYVDQEGDDFLEEEDYNDGEELLNTCKVPTLLKTARHPGRLATPLRKPRRRSCCEDHDCLCDEEQEQGYLWSSDCCEENNANVNANEYKGKVLNASPMPSNEKPWREGSTLDQNVWGSSNAKYKPRSSRLDNGSQGQMRLRRRRPSCKTFVQRPRRSECDYCEETEFPCSHRGRGTTNGRGTRY